MFGKHLLRHLLAGAAILAASQVGANEQPITFLVGFPPGGSTDTMARVVGEQVAKTLDRAVVVENRPGAGGRVAALALKNSAPDGNTYLVMPNASAVFNHLLYDTETLGYDLLSDMRPVAVFASGPMGLAVNSDLGVDSVSEYIEWVKQQSGGKGFFGSAGQGGQTHFSGLAFGDAAGVDMEVVPYKGNAPMVTDLIGGQIPAGISVVGDLLPHVESGRVKLLAVFGEERSSLVPDVPTFQEVGVDVVAGDSWTGMWTRAGSPDARVSAMQQAVTEALAQPSVQQALRNANLVPSDLQGDEMRIKVADELSFWAPIIKESGFTPDR